MFVDRFVKSNSVIGLGSGELVNIVIEEIGRRLAVGRLEGVTAVPACDAAAHEAAFHGVPLLPEDKLDRVSLLFDEVDQLDVPANAVIKGVATQPQQPQVPRLRSMLPRADAFVVLADSSAVVSRLGGSLPVWIQDDNWEETAEELDDIFLGDAEIWRRGSLGPTDNPKGGDHPYVSPDGHAIVDVRFYEGLKLYGEDEPYSKIQDEIQAVSGVVCTGMLLGAASAAVVARPGDDGPQVVELSRQ